MKFILIIILFIPLNVYAKKAVVDITNMSIQDLAQALDKGYLTSELLVELYLERIEAYNEDFNAVQNINKDALKEAQKLDQDRANGKVLSKLHGIPILVKSNIDVGGLATTAGAKALDDNFPKEDALVIKKLKEAGVIILGNTNMSEFAFSARVSKSSYGSVHNAFNLDYSPYGSSGGSAVAIATSMAAASLGTDTNSSVRVPAAAAGLVGLRPTFDLISTKGVIPYDITRDTVGIISKTVNDNKLLLNTIIDENDNDIKVKDLKVGVINSYLNNNIDSDIKKLALEKIKLLEDNGIQIVYIDNLLTSYYEDLGSSSLQGITFCDGFNEYIKGTTGKIRSFKELVYADGHIQALKGYLAGCNYGWQKNTNKINNNKKEFEERVLKVMEDNDIDIILYPTLRNKNTKINEEDGLSAPGSNLGSVIGYPSLTVPMGYISEFAYGLEFFTSKNKENELYVIGSYFEDLNNLELTNSELTPNLYNIPEYLNDLKKIYEKYYDESKYQELTNKTKEYFKNYSNNEDDLNKEEANTLIKEYQDLNKVETKDNALFIIIVIMFILSISIVFGSLITKKDKIRQKKIGKKHIL